MFMLDVAEKPTRYRYIHANNVSLYDPCKGFNEWAQTFDMW